LAKGLPGAQRLDQAVGRRFDAIDKFNRWVQDATHSGEPLTGVLLSFCFPQRLFNKRGDPGDPWGSFFLLVVTDHLASTGKKKPNHQLAYDLLAALRPNSVRVANPRQNVATRISQLKKADRRLCSVMLETVSLSFHKVPEYCQRFVSSLAASCDCPPPLGAPNVK
jgi:hypothetical protein